ncbi:MAG: hypothetical protein AAGN64_16885, partial [Bacteroidota bacterium]
MRECRIVHGWGAEGAVEVEGTWYAHAKLAPFVGQYVATTLDFDEDHNDSLVLVCYRVAWDRAKICAAFPALDASHWSAAEGTGFPTRVRLKPVPAFEIGTTELVDRYGPPKDGELDDIVEAVAEM